MHERLKAEVNYRLGRILYHSIVDAQGYPNGMPYWEEMKADDKYYYCLLAIDFMDKGLPEVVNRCGTYGLGENVNYGEGGCKDLMDYINEVGPDELTAFENRVKMVQDAYAKNKKEQDNVVDTQSTHSPDAE